jgi:hypothetical protein
VGDRAAKVTTTAAAPDKAKYLAFLDQEHKLRIRFDQIAATVGKARSDAHSSDERLRKAGDVFAEEAPKMHQVAQDMASVKAPPELEDSYAAYVRYIKAYADVLPAMARHAHEGKEGLVLGDLYGFLDNTDRADFKSKLIQQLRLRIYGCRRGSEVSVPAERGLRIRPRPTALVF